MVENLKIYEENLKNIKRLGQTERKELFIRYKNGDLEARKKFIESYLNDIRRIASKYENLDISIEDIIQDASIQLINHVDSIELSDIEKLSVLNIYLHTIIDSMVERAQYKPLLRTGENKILNSINQYIEQYESVYGCSPDECHIAAELGLSVEKVKCVLDDNKKLRYLDEVNEDSVIDEVSYEDIVCSKLAYKKLKEDILRDKKLTDLEKKYISSVYGFFDDTPKDYKEVSKIFNVSPKTVKQRTTSGIKKIRQYGSYVKSYR